MLTVYSRETAAETLGISVDTIDRYKKMGKMPWRQIGDRVVFTESDLMEFLDSCAVPATSLPSEREMRGVAKRRTEASA